MAYKNSIITIDGQAGAGKGTIGRKLAKMLGWYHFDSGSLYRAFAYAFTLSNLEVSELDALRRDWLWDVKLSDTVVTVLFRRNIREVPISISETTEKYFHTMDMVLYTPANTKKAAQICWNSELRKEVDALLVEMLNLIPVVMDGRDLGVSVFPEADLKVFLTADTLVRAQRKFQVYQQTDDGKKITLPDVCKALQERDETEEAGPLRVKPDAFYLDTTKITADEATEIIARKYLEGREVSFEMTGF